jgi:spore coat polysaccharide biosynthesis protein SpsF (cytidylyltransferase family)
MIGCIVQARMGSSRLPGKVLMKLNENCSTLDFILNQLSFSTLIDKTIIATTNLEEDLVIEQFAKNSKIEYFRGDSDDVLDRYYNCAKRFQLDTILRITSDCPLIDPKIIDQVIRKYQSGKYDYVTNTLTRTYPIGTDVEIFSFTTLEKAWKNATLPSEREHVTPFIRNKKLDFIVGNLENDKNLGHLRWTLDRQEDLHLIKEIIAKIDKNPILTNDILNLFSAEPELVKINEHIPQNDGMLKSLKKDEEFSKLKND